MTTYSTETLVINVDADGDFETIAYDTFELIAPDTARRFAYDVIEFDSDGLPRIAPDLETYQIRIGGDVLDLEPGNVDFGLINIAWPGGNEAILLTLFDAANDRSIIVQLDGDAFPEFADTDALNDLLGNATLTPPANGTGFGPNDSTRLSVIADGNAWDTSENDEFDGTDEDDTFDGGAGRDTINGLAGRDVIDGGKGNDTLLGGRGNDTLNGQGGDDLVEGGKGDDDLSGSRGDDTLNGQGGDDTLDGGDGDDELNGGAGSDNLSDGAGDDIVNGGKGDDTFLLGGERGRDTINGGRGEDTLIADMMGQTEPNAFTLRVDFREGVIFAEEFPDTGNDTFSGIENYTLRGGQIDAMVIGDGQDNIIETARGDDLVESGKGQDEVSTGGGEDTIDGGRGDDDLYGGGDADTLLGGDGADTLDGGRGNDTLRGNKGRDTLEGGIGDDDLYGGRGEDLFVFRAGDGDDVILDFELGSDAFNFGPDGPGVELRVTRNGDTRITYDDGNSSVLVEGVELTLTDVFPPMGELG